MKSGWKVVMYPQFCFCADTEGQPEGNGFAFANRHRAAAFTEQRHSGTVITILVSAIVLLRFSRRARYVLRSHASTAASMMGRTTFLPALPL